MPATIVLGGQWGDEGKGKVTDALAGQAQMVVRANGGSNAGHTVTTPQGVFKLHLVPSGILNPECRCVIGAGVVIDPIALVRELDNLAAQGISTDNLVISDRAHLVLQYHSMLDRYEEARRGASKIGTTLRGIGPAYSDKVARRGLRMADLIDEGALLRKLTDGVESKNLLFSRVYEDAELELTDAYRELVDAGARLRKYIGSAELTVQDALDAGSEVIVECAQGAMLDIDYGTYPYVTSSSPTAAGACQGAGVAPNQIDRVVGVFKAYSTRVGSGPMPAELEDETGELIRQRGREYGTTTGRPRRTGWFDAVSARYTRRLNGVSEIALTLLDVLDVFPEVKVCTSYTVDQVEVDHLPARDDLLSKVTGEFEAVTGWETDTTTARQKDDLPQGALDYITFLEEKVGATVSMVGVGPSREQLVPLTRDAAVLQVGNRRKHGRRI